MARIRIDAIDDPRIAHYRDLPRANLARESGLYIVEGRFLVERLVASHFDVESILVDSRRADLIPRGLSPEVPVYKTAPGLVDRIIGFNFHRGILACGHRKPTVRLDEAMACVGDARTIAVCQDIKDQANLGGILRNCAAFDVDIVLLSRHCADAFSRRVLRVSMGAVFKLAAVVSTDLHSDLLKLRDEYGCELVATVLAEDAETLDTATRATHLGLLFGNEGHGLADAFVGLCQRRVTIPMRRGTDSLNAAVASGLFLYHFTRIAKPT